MSKKRIIYAYTTKSYYDYRISHGDIPWLKIGDTERKNADIRVHEQDKTASPEKLEIKGSWEIDHKFRDHDIHNILKKEFRVRRIRKNREWFECDVADVASAINKLVKGVARPNNYQMRKEQEEAVEKAINYFINGGEEFLFNCKMRFGKTYTAYQLMKRMEAKKVLILTYKPSVVDAWKIDLNSHVDFEDYVFYHALDFSKKNPIGFNGNSKVVLFASFQDILGKNLNNNKIKEKWMNVINEYYDLIIIDEVHFGAEREKAKNLINKLNYKHRLAMSGTPIKLLLSGTFTEENTYTWSYNDEQKKRKNEEENGWKTEVYRWLPPMKIYAYSISKDVEELIEYYDDDEFLTLNKFFSSDDGKVLKNARAVERWLDLMAARSNKIFNSPFNNDYFTEKLRHTFWYLSGINHVKALAKMLRNHWYFGKYNILVAADDNEGAGNNTLEMVLTAIQNSDRTITLSCGKLNTGVTVPEWDGVFMLSDTKAPETYWQTAFRGQSSNKNIKEECFVFDFNPNRCLEMVYLYSEIMAKSDQSTTDSIREFLDVMEVYVYENNEFKPINIDEVIEHGINPESVVHKFESPRIINISNLTNEMVSFLSNVDSIKNKTIKEEISKSWLENGKTYKNLKRKEMSKEQKEKDNNIIAKALAITSLIPTFIFMSNDIEESIDDVLNTSKIELFEKIIGISIDDFSKMINSGFLKRNVLDRAIQALYLKS